MGLPKDGEASPRVTVVVPIYNAAEFLSDALDSVLAQTYDLWEAVLVDDGSTDHSLDIATEYEARHPGRFRVLQHDGGANRGVCASRNLAVGMSRGELIALLDADDIWLPHKLQEQVFLLDAHPPAELLFGHTLYWRSWNPLNEADGGDYIPSFEVEVDRLYPPGALNLLLYPLTDRTAPNPSDLLITKDLVQRIGGFEERFVGNLQPYEDQAFLSKAYMHGHVFISSSTWLHYRLHPASSMGQIDQLERPAMYHDFLEWFDSYLASQPHVDRRLTSAVRDALLPFRHPWLHRLGVKLGERSPQIFR